MAKPSRCSQVMLQLAFAPTARTPATSCRATEPQAPSFTRTAGSLHLVGGQVADLEGEQKEAAAGGPAFRARGQNGCIKLTTSIKLGAMSVDATAEHFLEGAA
ncbi:MAG: hypothetical protein U1F81_07235 [Verrucomicrobiaceae bacterium]